MTIEDIEIFLITAETRNISKTATTLYMAQSTVSHRLMKLEQELGAQLFIRRKGKRLLELTTQGKSFVQLAEKWIELWREAKSISSQEGEYSLNIGAVASINNHLFFPIYHAISQSKDPIVNICIKSSTSYALYTAMGKHEFDVAFVVQTAYHNTIESRAIFSEPLVLIHQSNNASPGQPLFSEEIDPLDLDLDKEILLNYQARYIQWRNRIWKNETSACIGTNDVDIAHSFLTSTSGSWCIVAMSIAMSFSRTTALAIHPIKRSPPDRICYVLLNNSKSRMNNKALRYFFDHLNLRMEELENKKHLSVLSWL